MMQHCVPLRKYWDPDVPGVCKLNNQQYLFAISIPNILIDVILLALPVRYVMRLEMNKRHKQTIVGMSTVVFGIDDVLLLTRRSIVPLWSLVSVAAIRVP